MLKGKLVIDKDLTPNEKGHLTILLMSAGKSDLLDRVLSGELGRNDVNELKGYLELMVAACEADETPSSASEQIAAVSRGIIEKFEAFLK